MILVFPEEARGQGSESPSQENFKLEAAQTLGLGPSVLGPTGGWPPHCKARCCSVEGAWGKLGEFLGFASARPPGASRGRCCLSRKAVSPAGRTACGLPGCLWLPAGVAVFEERSPVPDTASLACVTKGISFVNLTSIVPFWSWEGDNCSGQHVPAR